MQTFPPYPEFGRSAAALDRARLGKQRVEVLQILNVLVGSNPGAGWRNHPAVRMWRGHEWVLCDYGVAVCDEWAKRGYKDTVRGKILDAWNGLVRAGACTDFPRWIGDAAFHASHKSNLLRKDEKFYRAHGWTEPADLPYVWPA